MGEEECSEYERDQDCTSSVQLPVFCFGGTGRSITSLEERQTSIQTSAQEGGPHLQVLEDCHLCHRQIHSLPCRDFWGSPSLCILCLSLSYTQTHRQEAMKTGNRRFHIHIAISSLISIDFVQCG